MIFDKLLKLVKGFDETGRERLSEVLSSFFGEIIPYDFLAFEGHNFSLMDLKEMVGEDAFQSLYMCAIEFFLSNEYPSDSKLSEHWNAIDVLLKKRGSFLPLQDKMYLKGLRDSYMSIYEIIDIKLDQSITLRNLLEENQPPLIVKEKRGTHFLCQWDLLGARIIKTPQETVVAGGLLLLSRESAKDAKEIIDKIERKMMSKKYLNLFKQETKDPVLMIKKMWVKEIAQNWLIQKMHENQEPVLFNYDGDKLQFTTIEFPLTASTRELVQKMNKIQELIPHEIEGVTHAWFWPLEDRITPSKRKQKSSSSGSAKQHFVDTQLSDENGHTVRLFAELKIKKKKLIVDVNSEQRANVVEDFLQTQLNTLIGDSTRIHHELNLESEEENASLQAPPSELPKEKEAKFIQQMLDQHYRAWLDSSLPFLNHKTPREAVKTKKGLQTVIDLLKDMEDGDIRAVKQGQRSTFYNFGWLYSELGIERRLL